MPTATSFTWTFPWEEMVGGFNAFIGMLNTPIALAVSLILVFIVASFVVSVVRRARGSREVLTIKGVAIASSHPLTLNRSVVKCGQE